MNKDLKNKIAEDIQKNGYLTELRVGEKLKKMGWVIRYNQVYLDQDINKTREVDILASYHGRSEANIFANVDVHLVIETKKSDKPWVVFCTPKEKYGYDEINYQFTRWDNYSFGLLDKEFEGYIRTKTAFRGRSYYEAFKEYKEHSKIYESILKSSKAALFYKEKREGGFSPNRNGLDFKFNDRITLEIFIPVIVLEGILVRVSLNEKGEADILEEQYVPIISYYHDKSGFEMKFFPDLITLSHVEKYSKGIMQWIDELTKKVMKGREKLWEEYLQKGEVKRDLD